MAIHSHTRFPFIEIGTTADFSPRNAHSDPPGNFAAGDEWIFRICGEEGFVVCQSSKHASEEAEKHLFHHMQEVVNRQIEIAISNDDISLAMFLVERKGYWCGKTEERNRIRWLIGPAIAQLEQSTRS